MAGDEIHTRQRGIDRIWVWFGLMLWSLFAATATGTLPSDPGVRYAVAETFLKTGGVEMPAGTDSSVSVDGKTYSVFFPGQSILFLPCAAVGVLIGPIVGSSLATLAGRFIACTFWMPLFASAAVLGFAACLRLFGQTRVTACVMSLVLAVATPYWIYATSASEEIILAGAGIWSLWAVQDIRRLLDTNDTSEIASRAIADRIGLIAVLLAAGLLHRATFVVLVVGIGIAAMPVVVRSVRLARPTMGRIAIWLIVAIVMVCVLPAYNYVRFGSLFDNGYERFYVPYGGVFATPLLTGLAGHLVSPGKSIFLYVPLLILLPVALADRAVRSNIRSLLVGGAVMTALHFWIYSRHTLWSGEFCWAVRFHTSLLPFWFLPIALWCASLRRGLIRSLVGLLLAVSIVIQLAGLSFPWGLEHTQHPEYFTGYAECIPADAAWTWKGSQLRMRFDNIGRYVQGQSLLQSARADQATIFNTPNLFPMRAATMVKNRSAVAAAWAVWGILVAIFALATLRFWITVRSRPMNV